MISNKLQKFYIKLSQNKERNLIEDNFFNYLHKLSSPLEQNKEYNFMFVYKFKLN